MTSSLSTATKIHADPRRATLNLLAGSLWYAPDSFGIARALGSRYGLRSVLFHDISDTESSFTKGLGVTVTRRQFVAALKFITRHYTPISLDNIITDSDGKKLPRRPLLLTFDDAYTSVIEFAAPLCAEFGVPAVFFVNGACLNNCQLTLENLVCYVTHEYGLDTVNSAIRSIGGTEAFEVRALTQVFSHVLPGFSLRSRETFRHALIDLTHINEAELAAEASLYLSSQQLRDLATFRFEIGNHTFSHANCRTLLATDFAAEIDRNKTELEAISGTTVRSFSVPYGSSVDLIPSLAEHLRHSGYEAVFLAEGRANSAATCESHLDRVSIKASTDAAFFSEIEILPRLRAMRSGLFGISDAERSPRIPNLKKEKPNTFPCTSTNGAARLKERN